MLAMSQRGLGIAVNEMQRSLNGAGRYRRRQLGDVPNDFEASVDLQYIPVRQGWYYGYPAQNWTPSTVSPTVQYGLGGLRDDTQTSPEKTAIEQLAAGQRMTAVLQVVSTLSIAIIASLAIAKAIKEG